MKPMYEPLYDWPIALAADTNRYCLLLRLSNQAIVLAIRS